ncbi:MAG: superoxide dismutase [Syntrophorhabdaceae bacterium]
MTVSAGQPAKQVNIALFKPDPLPYAQSALEPYISARTISFHYGKHHQGYADTLNRLITGTRFADKTLETVILESARGNENIEIFNNAAQIWNHNFFWACMKKNGGGKPTGPLLVMIEQSFGSFDQFTKEFKKAATSRFGSGYAWLVQDGNTLKIISTPNADTPMIHGLNPLLTCDIWEHAYYLDYQNRRADFVQAFLNHLVNWEFVRSRLR